MKSAAEHAIEVESAYLAGVSANLAAAGGRVMPGKWFKREDHDCADRVKAEMVDRRIYDRALFARLPHGRGFTIRGFERRWIFGQRLRSVTVAGILAPAGPLLTPDAPAPPVTLAELTSHVRSLMLDSKTPHLIGICSPSGFAEEVWNVPLDLPNVKLVLIEPREQGGWRVASPDGKVDPRLCKLFDPEDVGKKIERVRREIEDRSTSLLTGGLTASSMAEQLDLPERIVQEAFAQAVKADPELRVSAQAGQVMLYRGASAASDQEGVSMSLSDRIRNLFSREGEETRKINELAERRARLSVKLDRMYEEIGKLEKKENELMEEGKASPSKVAKRRMAGQIAQMRKDISRCNTSAAILSKQINVISTHIHNLELAQTGSVAQLPTSEELTEAAVNAEEILEQLGASDALVSSLEVGMAESSISADEAAILKELEAAPAEKAAQPEPKDRTADRTGGKTKAKDREGGQAQAE
ncbi:MAG TPA: hypothetical protein VMV94_18125 [Phycisphaerae bacterium]|nr:hypothetical protein [Phycisphaerae bacterium]